MAATIVSMARSLAPKLLKKIAILAGLALFCCTGFAAESKEVAATNFAGTWLLLVDDGKYDQGWKETSASFQSTVKKDQWRSELQHSRHLLGKLRSRKPVNAVDTTKLSNGEEGEFVVVTFESGFERLGSGIETVIAQLESDGNWKIAGYFVKPADVD